MFILTLSHTFYPVEEAECDCRALDLLDSTVVDTSLDINRGMWMQKVSKGALDLLDSTV
jgi:hypothetical protein